MTGATVRRALTLAGVTGTLLAAFALPASAHVEVTPARAAPGQLQLYTIQVPNELPDQATVEVDITLPTGFVLDVAQALPGWQTVISKQAGAPVGVAWKGGGIPVGTFTAFQVQGRNPARSGPLTWRTVQRYERSTVTWSGAAGSAAPAPVVQLVKGAAAGGDTAASATAPVVSSSTSDQLARSRAAFAIAIGVAALGLVLAPLALAALRRWTAPAAPTAPPHTDATPRPPAAQQPEPSPGRPEPPRGRSPARSGQRRG